MSTNMRLVAPLSLLLAACAASGLDPLVLKGHELHASLVTRSLDEPNLRVPRHVRSNPQLSTDPEFLEAIGRGATQGRGLGREGIRAALYARYLGERGIGMYGFEAASAADADRIEGALRNTWSYAARSDQARVHRGGEVLVVVWADVESPGCWEAVNAVVVARLVAR
tara:strand:+ start:1520 stop:2023 length:504 start_codon:yes stop_codon:yes gene_type:complete